MKYARWEMDMENAIKRQERLEAEDGFDGAIPANRPNTKAKEGGSLYVEVTDLVRNLTVKLAARHESH